MSFRTDMWGQMAFLKSHQGGSAKRLKSVLSMLRQRIDIEEGYSQRMDKLQKQMKKSLTADDCFQLFRANVAIRAQEAREIAMQIKVDVLDTLQHHLDSLLLQNQAVFDKWNQNDKRLFQSTEKVRRFEQFYLNKACQHEELMFQDQCYTWNKHYQSSEDERIYHEYQYQKARSEAQELFGKYEESVKEYNSTLEDIQASNGLLLDQLQHMHFSLLESQKDSLVKLMIFEVSSTRNILYELDRSVKENLDKIDPSEQLSCFVKAHRSDEVPKSALRVEQHGGLLHSTLKLIQRPSLQKQPDPVQQAPMELRKVWSQEERDALLLSLGQEEESDRMMAYLDTLREEKQCQLDLLSFENVCLIVCALLDKYLQLQDVSRIYSVFEVANRLFHVRRKSLDLDSLEQPLTVQKIYLIGAVKGHPVWSSNQFWESLMIYQVHSSQMILQGDSNAQRFNLDIILFDKMAFVVQQALFFGRPRDQIKRILARFTKYLRLNEYHVKKLNAMLLNMKQQENFFVFERDLPQMNTLPDSYSEMQDP